MQDIIAIALVGAESYTTLDRTFRKLGQDGKVLHHAVTGDAWESLQDAVNPATGETLFILAEDLPEVVGPEGDEVTDHQDDGDMNTIVISPIANEDLADGPVDRSDLEDEEPVNSKIVIKPAAKTVTIGKASGKGSGKAVQV
jgi:hypothetical protein